MKRLQYILTTLFLGTSLTTFGQNIIKDTIPISNDSLQKLIIKDYMMENLDDPSSYQPVKFETEDSSAFWGIPKVEEQSAGLENLYQRINDIVQNFVSSAKTHLKTGVEAQLLEIINEYKNMGQLNYKNLVEMSALQEKLSKTFDSAITYVEMKMKLDEQLMLLKNHYDELERMKIEQENKLYETLKYYGFNPADKENNIRVVYHKYRARNTYNALVLKETIFVIDIKSKKFLHKVSLH